ncbi:MAG: leucine aminopeptidase-related protein [Polyangiaceae bacterium]|jgi:hypothetical protein|nr:leucine aminopeptidase-related protein [Polyangiaceae bacterium]
MKISKQLLAHLLALSSLVTGCGSPEGAATVGEEDSASSSQSLDPCADDPLEPNQSAVTAVNLPLGTQQQAVSCPQNVDFYSFQGPPPGTPFTVSLVFQSDDFDYGTDTGDLNALLRSQAGNLLFIGDREAKDNEFLPAVSDGGVYSLEIQSALRRVPYTVAVTQGNLRCGILDDSLEPNQSISEASLLTSTPSEAYICRGDSDYYRIQGPPAGQVLAVDLTFTPARGQLGLRMFDRNGERVGPEYTSGSPTTRLINSDGGVYFAEVFGYGKSSGEYSLQARATVPSCALEDAFEPNDTAATARPVPFGSIINGYMCQGGRDYYRFTGPPVGEPFQIRAAITNSVQMGVTDADGKYVFSGDTFSFGTINLVSNGRDYTIAIANPPTFNPVDAAYELTLQFPEPDTSCDIERDLEPLGRACKVANAGPFQAINLATTPSPTLTTSRSYVMKLAPSEDPVNGGIVYGGTAEFTAPETASYALFTGSPGIPLALSEHGQPVGYACSQSFGLRDCNKLLRGSRYELEAGHTYQLTFEPSYAPTQPSVRIGWERVADFTAPPLCEDLRNVEATCQTAEADTRTLAAGPLGSATSAPPVEESVSYGIRLVTGTAGNAGSVVFTPAITGQYVVYLGSNVPFSVWDGAVEVAASCASGLPTEVCSNLRRATVLDLEGGEPYRIDLGPTSPQSYVRFVVQPNIALAGECNLADLQSLEQICALDSQSTMVADVSNGNSVGLAEAVPYNIKLRPTEAAFRGDVNYYTSNRGRFAVYLGSAGVPLSVSEFGGRRYIQPLCTARLPSSSCGQYKVVQVYSSQFYRLLNLGLGPSSPQAWVRAAIGNETPIQP